MSTAKQIILILILFAAGFSSCSKSKKTNPASYRLKAISNTATERFDFYYNANGQFDSIRAKRGNATSVKLTNFSYLNNLPVKYNFESTLLELEYYNDNSIKLSKYTNPDSTVIKISNRYISNNNVIRVVDFAGGIDSTTYTYDNQNCTNLTQKSNFSQNVYSADFAYSNFENPFYNLRFLDPALPELYQAIPCAYIMIDYSWSKNLYTSKIYYQNNLLSESAEIDNVQINEAGLVVSLTLHRGGNVVDYYFEYEHLK